MLKEKNVYFKMMVVSILLMNYHAINIYIPDSGINAFFVFFGKSEFIHYAYKPLLLVSMVGSLLFFYSSISFIYYSLKNLKGK